MQSDKGAERYLPFALNGSQARVIEMSVRLTTDGNQINIAGDFNVEDFRQVLNEIHAVAARLSEESKRGLPRRPRGGIDFAQCEAVEVGAILPVVAQLAKLRSERVELSVGLPRELSLRNLFINGGWAHYLDPANYDKPQISTFEYVPLPQTGAEIDAPHRSGLVHIPVAQFSNSQEQGAAVTRVVGALLRSATGFARRDFSAVEWAINEVTDNVLVHAQSPIGGFIHVTNAIEQQRVHMVVADAGLGVPRTLRPAVAPLKGDADFLKEAIRERVTRDPAIGQGNGLYGTYRISEVSGAEFSLHAGLATLRGSRGELVVVSERITHKGTLVVVSMDYSQPNVLADALRFDGHTEKPSDYIELKYEMDGDGIFRFDLSKEADSFGSRGAGEPVRRKITNLLEMGQDIRAFVVDLSSVQFLSSSFADEVFGKLYLELGGDRFHGMVRFTGANPTVDMLVKRAILQRSAE